MKGAQAGKPGPPQELAPNRSFRPCHAERIEASRSSSPGTEMLRCAQHDKAGVDTAITVGKRSSTGWTCRDRTAVRPPSQPPAATARQARRARPAIASPQRGHAGGCGSIEAGRPLARAESLPVYTTLLAPCLEQPALLVPHTVSIGSMGRVERSRTALTLAEDNRIPEEGRLARRGEAFAHQYWPSQLPGRECFAPTTEARRCFLRDQPRGRFSPSQSSCANPSPLPRTHDRGPHLTRSSE